MGRMHRCPPRKPEIIEFSTANLPAGIEGIFINLSQRTHPIFLDGSGDSLVSGGLNRYSFLSADPIDRLIVGRDDDFEFETLRKLIERYPAVQIPDLPSFQGGIAGLLTYEFNSRIEKVAPATIDEFNLPQLSLFIYDVVIAIDHQQQTGWVISQGWTASETGSRDHAKRRLDEFKEYLLPPSADKIASNSNSSFTKPNKPAAAMHVADTDLELYSDFSKAEFLQMIDTAVEYIRAGDIFQVNLSQRLLTPATKTSPQLYLDMRTANPAPFSGYLDMGDSQLISASPERLLSCHDRRIQTRPIKGTRRRTHYPEIDLEVQTELMASEKDRAENIMIVDLMRNDLARVSDDHSVVVSKLCEIEQYQNVLHLVSVVESKLAAQFDSVDLLRAVFPGGSITGAPKIRAMEIIAELEPTAREAYCGSLGYITPSGDMDFSILIRSVTAKGGWWQLPVGGGIVADSKPEQEYEETWTKAIGMLKAIASNNHDRDQFDLQTEDAQP